MSDEPIIYGLMIAVGAIASASELGHGADMGTRATVALFILVAGIVGMVRSWAERSGLPRAWIHRR
jgi:hypothetical protein